MARYSEEILNEVRQSNDIVDVISQYVHLKRSGRNFFGLCPFHNEKSPSFSVSPDKQIFHCFGCGVGGNVITFVSQIEGLNFVETVQMLAERANIQLPTLQNNGDTQREILKDKVYKVNERMTTYSYEAHLKYTGRNYTFAAKSLMASCLDQTALIGGYGISSVDPKTGEQEYTPFRHSTTWANFTYGTKWKTGLFLGYTKNLGTDDELTASKTVYGMGLDIDQLFTVNMNFSYNLPHWQIGLEYSPATAWYGTIDQKNGKVGNTHAITNHRILGLVMYYF